MLYVLCAALALFAVVLILQRILLRRELNALLRQLDEKLNTDTNTLLSVLGGDRALRRFAAGLNEQLRLLRKEWRRYESGNRDNKDAITNISHDLRTPLTAICGYLDLLEGEEKSETVARYLAQIENRAQALKQLTEELFRYSVITSAPDSLRMERVCLNSALEESIAACYSALKARGIVPDIHMPAQSIVRTLDRAALSRIFGNILTNALKYSDGDLRIALSEAGEITFTNSAAQLDPIQVGRLFERFYTVEAARKSTGLGLAIARALVEQMQGTISAQLENRQLSIRIRFPEIQSGG